MPAAGPERQDDPACWRIAAAVGEPPSWTPGEGDTTVPIDDDLALVLRGRALPAADRRIVEAFAAQAAVALRQERLAAEAAQAAAAGRGRQDAHRPARRGQPRPAHPAGLGQGGGGQPAQRRMSTSPTRTARSCWPPPTESLDRLSRLIEQPARHEPAAGRRAGRGAPRRSALEEVVPARSTTSVTRGRSVSVRIPDDLPDGHGRPGPAGAGAGQPDRNALRTARPTGHR